MHVSMHKFHFQKNILFVNIFMLLVKEMMYCSFRKQRFWSGNFTTDTLVLFLLFFVTKLYMCVWGGYKVGLSGTCFINFTHTNTIQNGSKNADLVVPRRSCFCSVASPHKQLVM